VRDGQFEFTVTSIEQNGAKHLGSGLFSADAKGEYVIVHVHVKNTGTDQRGLTSTAQKLIDGRGRKYSADGGADLALDDNDSTDLNPGLSVDRQVAFDVPAGTVIQTVELHDSLFSGGVKVDVGQ